MSILFFLLCHGFYLPLASVGRSLGALFTSPGPAKTPLFRSSGVFFCFAKRPHPPLASGRFSRPVSLLAFKFASGGTTSSRPASHCRWPWPTVHAAVIPLQRGCATHSRPFTNTETKRTTTLPPIGQIAASPEGPGRSANKPLMKKRTELKSPLPIGNHGGNTFFPWGCRRPAPIGGRPWLFPWTAEIPATCN